MKQGVTLNANAKHHSVNIQIVSVSGLLAELVIITICMYDDMMIRMYDDMMTRW